MHMDDSYIRLKEGPFEQTKVCDKTEKIVIHYLKLSVLGRPDIAGGAP